MSIEQTLLSIVRRELSEDNQQDYALEALDAESYFKLYHLAKKHGIAQIVASAYSKAEMLGKDVVSKKFFKSMVSEVYKKEQQNYVISEVCGVFDKLHISYIPLKGSVICHYYPEDWMRSCCDIDILIKESDAQQAIQHLCELGYRLQKDTSIHDYSLFSPLGIHLELHFTLMQEDCLEKANSVLASAWEYTVSDDASDYRKNLTNEMFLLYHIAHMAKHFMKGGCGIKPFIDLWILKRKMEVNTEILEKLLHDAQLFDFYTAVYDVVSVWFENAPHNNITLCIEEYVLRGGVYGNINNATLVEAAMGTGKTQSLMKWMFLPRRNLEILYPRLERYPFLLPFYQVKRWFRIFNKKKRKKVQKFTAMRSAISQEDIHSTAGLLDYLGLTEKK